MRRLPLHTVPQGAWLHCPHCGASKYLRDPEDLPRKTAHIYSPCPDCHGTPELAMTTTLYDKEITHGHHAH
jgi:hypothetical protein